MRWRVVIGVLAVLGGCSAPSAPPVVATPAIASSPGPLIANHARLACAECHEDGSPRIAVAKCTSCHSALGARVAANEGLHAKPSVRGHACIECHLDHRGRSFDVRWSFFGGFARFDHALTGWTLDKGHRIACAKCHPSATASAPSFAGAKTACASCHAQPHAGTPYATLACETCHRADRFQAVAFDHDERARPIGTSHRKVACASCHTAQLGATSPPLACASCHASRDPHGGRFSAFACESCHAPSIAFTPGQPPPAWKPNRFDHGAATGWALTPWHTDLTCRSCHSAPGTALFVPLHAGKDCLGCHEHQNVHDRKYPSHRCLSCHFL